MIVLVCGPSGAGKTSFLSAISSYGSCAIKKVTVCRSHNRTDVDVAKDEVSEEAFSRLKSTFEYIYNYDKCKYAFSLSTQDIESKTLYFLDYPGEYPACVELKNIFYAGLLILPPNRDTLIKRLLETNRSGRIPSALSEYDECFEELSQGIYSRPQWDVFISDSPNSIDTFLAKFIKAIKPG